MKIRPIMLRVLVESFVQSVGGNMGVVRHEKGEYEYYITFTLYLQYT